MNDKTIAGFTLPFTIGHVSFLDVEDGRPMGPREEGIEIKDADGKTVMDHWFYEAEYDERMAAYFEQVVKASKECPLIVEEILNQNKDLRKCFQRSFRAEESLAELSDMLRAVAGEREDVQELLKRTGNYTMEIPF